jgi:hypothetical protein
LIRLINILSKEEEEKTTITMESFSEYFITKKENSSFMNANK